MSHMKLDEPVRQLNIAHGYYSDAYFHARRSAGLPVPHEVQPVERTDSRPIVQDWRVPRGEADLPAGGAP